MIRYTRRSFIPVLAALLMLMTAVTAPARAAQVPSPSPILTDVSDSATPDQFSVAGRGFTPGAAVYLAIYDQLGLKLYEDRTVTASNRLSAENAWVIEYSGGDRTLAMDGGRIRETFAGLCNASALIRAFDESAERWTNWLTIQPNCPERNGSVVANDLNASPRLPVASPDLTAAETANDLYASPAGQGVPVVGGPTIVSAVVSNQSAGSITVYGQGFSPNDRVYLVISDQKGAKLYPTRWITSTPLTGYISGFMVNSPEGHPIAAVDPDGIVQETFDNLCGANAMVRAYDQGTEIWSNWVTFSAGC
jgi:hypothetical protein